MALQLLSNPFMTESPAAPDIAELARQYGPLVYRAAYRLLGNHASAQDVQQDLFMRLLETPARNVESWPAYLTASAVRMAIDRLRRQRRWRRVESLLGWSEADAPFAEQDIDSEQEAELLRSALSKLKARDATCVVLRLVHGLDIGVVAAAMGMSTNHVSVTLHRAVRQLEKYCASVAGGEGALS